MKIIIGKPYISEENNHIRLNSEVTLENETIHLYFDTDKRYGDYLLHERSDAFIVGILAFAMAKASNTERTEIICEAPVSEQLFYQLTQIFIPTMSKAVSWCNTVTIIAEKDNTIIGNPYAVGTGISGGVDSYYALLKQLNNECDSYKLTHGLFCEIEDYGDLNKVYKGLAESICQDLGIEFIDISSNIGSSLYRMFHENIGKYIILSHVFALSKLFKTYYLASAHSFWDFKFDDYAGERFSPFDASNLGTESLRIYIAGGDAARHEKTSFIADYTTPRRYFMVCRNPRIVDGKLINCSRCSKCTRTIIDLDIHGKADRFKDVFDIDYYEKHKNYYWGYLFFKGEKNDPFIAETMEYVRTNHIRIPFGARISGIFKIIKNGFKRGNPLAKDYRI